MIYPCGKCLIMCVAFMCVNIVWCVNDPTDIIAAIYLHTRTTGKKYSLEAVAGIQPLDEHSNRKAKGNR